MHFRLAALISGVLLAAWPAAVSAQSVQLLGTFHDWSAYSASEGAGAMCFAMASPSAIEPSPDGYTQAYLYLTHRPSRNVDNEINLVAGFEFAPDQPAILSVGGQDFELFTQKDAAWLLDQTRADALAGAIRAGSTLTIEGTTSKGIKIDETFSLSGATAASRAIDSGC